LLQKLTPIPSADDLKEAENILEEVVIAATRNIL